MSSCGGTLACRGPSLRCKQMADFNSDISELDGMLSQKALGCLSTVYHKMRLDGADESIVIERRVLREDLCWNRDWVHPEKG